jgi:hypothetical protein
MVPAPDPHASMTSPPRAVGAFEVGAAFGAGWTLLNEHAVAAMVGLIVMWVVHWILAVPDIVLELMEEDAGSRGVSMIIALVRLALQLVTVAVSTFLWTGYVRITLDAVRSTPEVGLVVAPQAPPPTVALLFSQGPRLLRAVGAQVLAVLAVLAGLVVLVAPGVYLALGLTFTLHLVVDRGLGPVEAVKESWRITRGHRLRILVFWTVATGAVVAGFLCCGVGLLVAVPVVYLALAHLYLEIAGTAPAR